MVRVNLKKNRIAEDSSDSNARGENELNNMHVFYISESLRVKDRILDQIPRPHLGGFQQSVLFSVGSIFL